MIKKSKDVTYCQRHFENISTAFHIKCTGKKMAIIIKTPDKIGEVQNKKSYDAK